jgi:hypothetical protein
MGHCNIITCFVRSIYDILCWKSASGLRKPFFAIVYFNLVFFRFASCCVYYYNLFGFRQSQLYLIVILINFNVVT